METSSSETLMFAQIASISLKGVMQQRSPESSCFWVRFVWWKWGQLRSMVGGLHKWLVSKHPHLGCLIAGPSATNHPECRSPAGSERSDSGIAPVLLCPTDEVWVRGELHSGWLLGPSLVSYHRNLCDNDRCQLFCATATFNSVTAGFALAYNSSHLADSPNWLWIQTGNLPFYRPRF